MCTHDLSAGQKSYEGPWGWLGWCLADSMNYASKIRLKISWMIKKYIQNLALSPMIFHKLYFLYWVENMNNNYF